MHELISLYFVENEDYIFYKWNVKGQKNTWQKMLSDLLKEVLNI